MSNEFSVKSDIRRLTLWTLKAPMQFRRAMAGYLNTSAFGSRKKSQIIIQRSMVVRAPGFILGSIRVERASPAPYPVHMTSMMGSVKRERYSGLAEQETGQAWATKRTNTVAAREGSPRRIIPKKYRMGRKHRLLTDVVDLFVARRAGRAASNQSHSSRVAAALAILTRKNDTRPFIIGGTPGRKSGLYRLDGGKLVMLQRIKRRSIRPKRVEWMSGGVKKFYQFNRPNTVWRLELARQGLKL